MRIRQCIRSESTFRLLQMVLNVLAVLVLSKHIEPVYGSKSYLKFLAIVLSCSGFCAFVSVRMPSHTLVFALSCSVYLCD